MVGARRCSSLAASVYLVYVLEILKFKRLARPAGAARAARGRPSTRSRRDVAHELETGEFQAVGR